MPPPTVQQLQKQLDQLKSDLKQKDDRDRKRTQSILLLDALSHRTMGRTELLFMTARNIGTAYLRAAKNHRDALEHFEKIKALEKQVLYSVLTVLSTGALTWVWETQTLVKMGRVLGPVLKDALSAGCGEVFSANGPLYDPPDPSPDGVSEEPQEFQNALENRVSGFKITALDGLAKLADRFRTFEDADWDKWDLDAQKKAFSDWQDQLFAFSIKVTKPALLSNATPVPGDDSLTAPSAAQSEQLIAAMARGNPSRA